MTFAIFILFLIGAIAIAALVISVLAYTKTPTATNGPIVYADDFVTHYPSNPTSLNEFMDTETAKTRNIIGSTETGTIFNNIVFQQVGTSIAHAEPDATKLSADSGNLIISSGSSVSTVLTSASGLDASQLTSGTLESDRLPTTITGDRDFTGTMTVSELLVVSNPLLRCFTVDGGNTVFPEGGGGVVLTITNMQVILPETLFTFSGPTNFKVTYTGTEPRDIKAYFVINSANVNYGNLQIFLAKNVADPLSVPVPNIVAFATSDTYFDVIHMVKDDFFNICGWTNQSELFYLHPNVNLILYA